MECNQPFGNSHLSDGEMGSLITALLEACPVLEDLSLCHGILFSHCTPYPAAAAHIMQHEKCAMCALLHFYLDSALFVLDRQGLRGESESQSQAKSEMKLGTRALPLRGHVFLHALLRLQLRIGLHDMAKLCVV